MAEGDLRYSDLTRSIIGAFYDVHRGLGFGYLESTYATALEQKLRDKNHEVAREFAVRVIFEGREVGFHRLDMVVDGKVVVEIKSTLLLHPSARRQLHSYLKATNLEVGLLLHFGESPKFHRLFVEHGPRRTL
jgi:GxxExxY protein